MIFASLGTCGTRIHLTEVIATDHSGDSNRIILGNLHHPLRDRIDSAGAVDKT